MCPSEAERRSTNTTTLHPNVVIYEKCRIGKRCIIHFGCRDRIWTVSGFVWDGERHVKIPQKGIVIIGDDVEIGSNCTIDRAPLTITRIGST
jgi:UDP-3-O-[3-hydroxymyristoyl] glucosamine N-acyltransferase